MTHLHSNAAVYQSIAEEANAEAQRLWQQARTPKPDGSESYVITLDPQRRSFKQSLIAIAFSGIYLEALLYLVGSRRMGKRWKNEFDGRTYEDKLSALGVSAPDLLASAKRLRLSRRDLVHEKAVPVEQLASTELRWAHEEAAAAVQFISRVSQLLQSAA